MEYFALVLLSVVIASGAAAPTSGEQLDKEINVRNIFKDGYVIDKELYRKYRKLGYYFDKATVNDVAVNSVEDKKTETVVVVEPNQQPQSTVQITGITTGASAPQLQAPSDENQPFKPQRAGSMFARFIDDIFQIPINVLQNVARLITSPFTSQKKTPEVVATVS